MTQLGMVITTKPGFFSRKDIQPTGLPGYGCAYATYLLGTEAWAGTDFGPTEDATMNGRNLVVTGTVGAKWVAGPSNYVTTPFNGDQLCSRTGKCTIIAVTRIAPGVSAWPISNHTNVASSSYLGIFATNNSTAYSARHYVNGDDRRSDDNGNASTRSGFEFIAGTFGVDEGTKLFRSATGDDLHVRPADLTPPIATLGGDLPFLIGRSHVLGTNGNCDVAFASFFDDILTPAQIEEYLTYVTALLGAGQGVVVEGGSAILEGLTGTPEQIQIDGATILTPLVVRAETAAALADSEGNATIALEAAAEAEAWAEGDEPGGPGTLSSKGWSERAEEAFSQITSIETTGRPTVTSTVIVGAASGTYVFADPVKYSGIRNVLRLRNPTGNAVTLNIGRAVIASGTVTPIGGYTAVNIPAGPGNFVLPISVNLERGQHISFSGPLNFIAYENVAGDSGGYYRTATQEAATPFAAGALNTSLQLQIGFDASYGTAVDDAIAIFQPQIDDLDDQVDLTSGVATAAADKVDAVTQLTTVNAISRVAGSYSTFVNGTPAVTAWAAGFYGGDLLVGSVIKRLFATVHLPVAATTLRARLVSAPANSTGNPDTFTTNEWGSPVTVDVSATTKGAFVEVGFASPTVLARDTAKAYYLIVEGFDSGNNPVNIGYGNVGGGASYTQVQRGYYRPAGMSFWTAVGTAGLTALRIEGDQVSIRPSALPAPEPSTTLEVDLLAAAYVEIASTGLSVSVSGHIRRNGASEPIAATIAMPAAAAGKERVDLLVASRVNGAITRIAGTDRTADLDAAEWQAPVPGNSLLLSRVLVKPAAVVPVNAAQFRGLIRVGREGEFAAHISRNQRMIPRTLGKAARGAVVKLAGYGDSITALQSTSGAASMPYTANGTTRDRPELYFGPYPSDTLALMQRYDFSDGAGSVHIKEGWNWYIKAALDRLAGAEVVQYLNFGIGGTTSGATQYNGLFADRMAALLAAAPDVVNIAFGMNERGSTGTYANLVNMVGQIKAIGAEVILTGCPRPGTGQSVANWRFTNDAIEAAAMDADCALLSTTMIADDRNLGAMIPAEMLGAVTEQAGASNHPGLWELGRYGLAFATQLGI